MSEIISNISLHPITAPALNQTDYATQLAGVFNNIDDNFKILSNPMFTKGEKGESLSTEEVYFFDESNKLNSLGEKLKSCIESISANKAEYNDITYIENGITKTLSVFDNFYTNPGTIKMIYSTDSKEYVSSLYYVFLDGRFANNVIGKIDDSNYSNTRDMSCIVVYENGNFRVLPNAFPTIYYEKNIGLCWKVNGAQTGIPVKGAPGKDGYNSRLNIVKCTNAQSIENNAYIRAEVSEIYGAYEGYTEIPEENLAGYDQQSAVILINSGEYSSFYFGYLDYDKNSKKLYANCDQETSLNIGFNTQGIINAFKNINILNSSQNISEGLKGLFIPIRPSKNTVQPVHLLTATAITNTKGDSTGELCNDVVFTAVNDINTLDITDDENKSLKVDKYLYLKVNTDADFFNVVNESLLNSSDLNSYGGILKYKLTNLVVSVNSIGNVNNNMIDTFDTKFGYHDDVYDSNGNKIVESSRLNHGKVAYYSTLPAELGISSGDIFTLDHRYTIPKKFAERLRDMGISGLNSSEIGIYCWELCKTKHTFDVDELTNNNIESDEYTFPTAFNTIYTLTINPTMTTDIMWFNGMETITYDYYQYEDDSYNNDGYIANGPTSEFNGKFVIPGWNSYQNDIFEFKKFIPVYDNDYAVAEDTALNLNYNVNITGDAINPERNITVNGSINCDNISVHKLTATEEIKNIYTKDDIIGDAGIKLAKFDDEHLFVVDASGNTQINSLNVSNDSTFNGNVNCDKIYARQSINSELRVNNTNENRQLFAGNIGDSNNYKFGLELNDVASINIERSDNPDITSVIESNVPILSNDNSSITVANQHTGSENICYYNSNNSKDLTIGTVKDFNIDKLLSNRNSSLLKLNKIHIGSCTSNYTNNTNLTENVFGVNWPGSSRSIALSTENITNSNKSKALQSFSISKQTAFENNPSAPIFDRNNKISILFDNSTSYVLGIGVNGECSYGRWPVMHKSYSSLTVEFYCEIDGTFHKIQDRKYTINHASDNFKDDCSGGAEWRGHDYGGETTWRWRWYEFKFKIDSVYINPSKDNNSVYQKIAQAYDAGKTINFYVWPKFYLDVRGQIYAGKHKKVLSGVKVSIPVPVADLTTDKDIPTAYNVLYQTGAPKTGWKYTKSTNSARIRYDYLLSSNDNVNITTVCQDGVVIRANDNIFGVGNITDSNTNKPALFYYTYDANNTTNKTAKTILLDDIYKLINYAKTQNWIKD